jgi:hypothetical protein
MKKISRFGLSAAIAVLAAGVSLTPAQSAEPMLEAKVLEKMSKNAQTPEDHAKVAKQYRLRAESLQEKAEKHEADARKLRSTNANPMASKWPAMVNNGADRERRLAMQARRAAQECFELANHHVRLAVETQLAE